MTPSPAERTPLHRVAQAEHLYPGDLREQIETYLERWPIPRDVPRELFGGVLPHAGWMYSGHTAARTLHTLIIRALPRTIFFCATAPHEALDRIAVYARGVWETPAGPVEVDEEAAQRFLGALPDHTAEAPEAHDRDHAIEVQIPMLRLLAPGCRIVPVSLPVACDAVAVGEALGQQLANQPSVLVVACSDLTRYGADYGFTPAGLGESAAQWMRENDASMVQHVVNLEAEEIPEEATNRRNAGSASALQMATAAARTRGAEQGHVVEYTTSYEEVREEPFTSGVGYLGAVFG